MGTLPYNYILIGAGAIIVVLALWLIRLEVRIARLTRGKSGADLEDSIGSILVDLKNVFNEQSGIKSKIAHMDGRIIRSVQRVDTVRFNPFASQGGNQSFSTLLLNENGDGVVLTGLYTREKSSVYAKPIKGHKSEFDLSEEEQALLDTARK